MHKVVQPRRGCLVLEASHSLEMQVGARGRVNEENMSWKGITSEASQSYSPQSADPKVFPITSWQIEFYGELPKVDR